MLLWILSVFTFRQIVCNVSTISNLIVFFTIPFQLSITGASRKIGPFFVVLVSVHFLKIHCDSLWTLVPIANAAAAAVAASTWHINVVFTTATSSHRLNVFVCVCAWLSGCYTHHSGLIVLTGFSKIIMDLTSIFLFCLISLVIGAVLMILVQYYVFIKYFNQPDDDPNAAQRNRSLNEKYQLPDVSKEKKCAFIYDKFGSNITK